MKEGRISDLAFIQKLNLVLWPVSAGIAALVWSPRMGWSVALGGALGASNLLVTAWVIRKVFVPEPDGSALLLLGAKFGGFLGVTAGMLWFFRPQGLAFGLGFCSILASSAVKAMIDAIRLGREVGEEPEEREQEYDERN